MLLERVRRRERAAVQGPDAREVDERGVSGIIELVIVLVILGILTAILLPTFLGTSNNAKTRSAENNLSVALTAAQTVFANATTGQFPAAATLQTTIKKQEPELVWVTGATNATTSGAILLTRVSNTDVVLGVYSPGANGGSGGCIYANLNNGPAVASGLAANASNALKSGAAAGTTYAVASGGCAALTATPTGGWGVKLPS
jgi:type IV pilus assembly protein PilA